MQKMFLSCVAVLSILAFFAGAHGQSPKTCAQSKQIDLQLIVDSSGSIREDRFHLMMDKIAENIINQFDVAKDKTRVALFKYSSHLTMKNEFGLKTHSSNKAVKSAMDAVVFEAGWTNTAEAMREALKIYTKDARKDKFTAKVCIVFTDGQATDAKDVPAAAQAWAKAGVTVFAVGIGHGIDHEALSDIAGADDRVIQATDFGTIGNVAKSLMVGVCKAIPVHPCDQPKKGGCQQTCVKKGNQAVCACKDGYKLRSDKKTCYKVHPCDQPNKGGCKHKCVKKGTQAVCACNSGYKLGSDRKTCNRLHPCEVRNGGCQHICRRWSNYRKSCACHKHYRLERNKRTCKKKFIPKIVHGIGNGFRKIFG